MKKSATTKTVKIRRKYDDAYKQQALQMMRNGQSVPTGAEALGISEGLLNKWKQSLRSSEADQELEQLRQKLKQIETERNISKKP